MEIMDRLGNAGIIPVAVIEQAEDAVPTAKALLAGGIDVMEITFRAAAARDRKAPLREVRRAFEENV